MVLKRMCIFRRREAIGSHKMESITSDMSVPNIMPVTIIIFSISIGGVILSIASLSFLGFGLPPALPEWGGLLSVGGSRYLEMAPWLAVWPGLFLTITIYSLNMFGDAVRDLLDPRLRGSER